MFWIPDWVSHESSFINSRAPTSRAQNLHFMYRYRAFPWNQRVWLWVRCSHWRSCRLALALISFPSGLSACRITYRVRVSWEVRTSSSHSMHLKGCTNSRNVAITVSHAPTHTDSPRRSSTSQAARVRTTSYSSSPIEVPARPSPPTFPVPPGPPEHACVRMGMCTRWAHSRMHWPHARGRPVFMLPSWDAFGKELNVLVDIADWTGWCVCWCDESWPLFAGYTPTLQKVWWKVASICGIYTDHTKVYDLSIA